MYFIYQLLISGCSNMVVWKKTPHQYHQRVDALLADVWQNPAQACADMQDLIDEVEQLIHREGS